MVLSRSWWAAPSLNHQRSTKLTFISAYEDAGQPWSWLYRTCDILAALLLGLAVWAIARRPERRPAVLLLALIALGSLVDATFPSAGITRFIHAGESVITTLALLALNAIWAFKKVPWARPVLVIQLTWIIIFLIGQLTTQSGNTLIQFTYQVIVTIWLAGIVPDLAGRSPAPAGSARSQLAVHLITAWIFFGGFLAVVSSVRNIEEISEFSSAYFGNNTAWLSQHGVAVGVVLMYISRHLWRGEFRAWQLASLLLWLETIKYAVISPNVWLVLLYGLTAAALLMRRDSFNRLTSTEELRERIKKLLYVALAVIIALFIGVVTFRFKRHQDIDTLRLNIGHFVRHLFLFDVVNDLGPLPRRLLGQVLNVAGLALLLAVLVSLFRPQKPLLGPANEHDRQQLLRLLNRGSTSSEDYFKYWPQPKSYWWNAGRDTVIAYQVTGNVAFALADPIGQNDRSRRRSMKDFMDYCRSNGWRACFLMVQNEHQTGYKQADIDRKSQRFDGKIQEHIQPQPHEFSKCVARRSADVGTMLDCYLPDFPGRAVNQTVDVRKRTAILDDFVDQETVHYLEAREIKIFRFVQHHRRHPIVEAAARVAKPRMLLVDVMSVNHVMVLAL